MFGEATRPWPDGGGEPLDQAFASLLRDYDGDMGYSFLRRTTRGSINKT